MKYEVIYKINDVLTSEFFCGDNPGEAFASCLLRNSEAILIKCRKGGSDFAEAWTEWSAPPVQRRPNLAWTPPSPKIPKYKQTPDPMPSMRKWCVDHGLLPP